MKTEDIEIPESTAEESFRVRARFYRFLDESSRETVVEDGFAIAVQALAMGFYPHNRVDVDNETPNDMDGLVFKVTIS